MFMKETLLSFDLFFTRHRAWQAAQVPGSKKVYQAAINPG